MAVLTLAAQQLGPRLIHHFMASRRTQIPVTLFLSTVIYLLLVLRAVHGQTNETGVPNLAVRSSWRGQAPECKPPGSRWSGARITVLRSSQETRPPLS